MSVLNREEFFARLDARLANDTTDEGISFLEDMTDTYNELERKANGDGIDWETKYKELDESWKKRYRHRFFSGGANESLTGDETVTIDEYSPEDVKVDDLFTKKEEE
jgi:hypothetical protein